MLRQAQTLVNQASRAFGEKDFQTALDALTKAERLADAASDPALPRIRFNIARCLEKLERWDEALAAYKSYNELPDESHRKQRAWEAMRKIRSKVYAKVSVVCSPQGALIEIAGVTDSAVSCPWQSEVVPPGAYAVKISHPGYESTIETIDVAAGKSVKVEVSLKSLLPQAGVTQVVSEPVNPWPWLTMGAGLVVAATGGFFTSSAVDDRDEIEVLPPGNERSGLEDDFTFNRNLSYALYGTGAALVAGGLVWWLVETLDDGDETAAIDIRPGPRGFEVRF